MTQMQELNNLLKKAGEEMPGVIVAGVVGSDGIVLAEYTTNPAFKTEVCGAQFSMVMKLGDKMTTQLGDELMDNLVTTDDAYLLTTYLGDGSFYLGIAAAKEYATLGNIRLVAREYKQEIWDAIPQRK